MPKTKQTIKRNRIAPKISEDASTLMKTVDGVELRLTSMNRLFVKKGKMIAWPGLSGQAVYFDLSGFEVSRDAHDAIKNVLLKQDMIRKQHAEDFEEEENDPRYNFN